MANYCAIEFYQFPPEFMKNTATNISGFNEMRVTFDPVSNFLDGASVEDQERQFALNIRYFRRRTMRVRSKPYFGKLLNELLDVNKYPNFGIQWQKSLCEEHDDFALFLQKPNSEQINSFLND